MPACRNYPCPAQWETAASLLDAAAAHTDNRAAKLLNGRCFRRCSPLVYTLPCRVNRFSIATEQAYGPDESVLACHTLFNYFRHGMPPAMEARARWQLIYGVQSRTSCPRLQPLWECGNRFGLQCPECAKAACCEFGRRISFCAHCCPFVTRCPLHGSLLYCDNECSSLEYMVIVAGDARTAWNSLQFSLCSHQLACTRIPKETRQQLKERLAELGYVSESGRTRLARLKSDFTGFYCAGFEDVRLNALIGREDFVDNLMHGVQRDTRPIHPVYLTLLDVFLANSDGVSGHATRHRSALRQTEGAGGVAQSVRRTPVPQPASLEERRGRWATFVKSDDGLTRTQMRKKAPALWTWLYRHDREWLLANQPSCVRPHSGRRPSGIPPQLGALIRRHAGHKPLDAAGRVRLPSLYQTRLAYGLSDYAFLRSRREFGADLCTLVLPGLKAAFVRQRVRNAIGEWGDCGCVASASVIARKAGLRESTVRKYVPVVVTSNRLEEGA